MSNFLKTLKNYINEIKKNHVISSSNSKKYSTPFLNFVSVLGVILAILFFEIMIFNNQYHTAFPKSNIPSIFSTVLILLPFYVGINYAFKEKDKADKKKKIKKK